MRIAVLITGVILLGAVCLRGQTPLRLDDAPVVAQLQRDLGSAEYAVREKAQSTLAGVGLDQLETLRSLALAATDAEVQARLMRRVNELDLQKLMEPPPISVHLKDAKLDAVAEALSKATGVTIGAGKTVNAAELYTLDLDNKPFWEVTKQLNAQHPIWFGLNGVLSRDTYGWREQSVMPGYSVFIENLKRIGVAPAAGVQPAVVAGPARFNCGLGIGVDPRVHVVEVRSQEVAPIVDDQGHAWATTGIPTTSTKNTGTTFFWMRSMNLQATEGLGTKIKEIRGSITLVVAVPDTKETRELVATFSFKDLPIPQ